MWPKSEAPLQLIVCVHPEHAGPTAVSTGHCVCTLDKDKANCSNSGRDTNVCANNSCTMHIDKSKSLSVDIDLKFTYSPAECQSTDQTKNSKKKKESHRKDISFISI